MTKFLQQLLFIVCLFSSVTNGFQFTKSKLGLKTALRMSTNGISKYLASKKPIFVAGGTKGVGLELVKLLSANGNPVHCLARTAVGKNTLSAFPNVKVFMGDAFDAAAVQKSMDGCVAAVTTLGGVSTSSHEHERVDYVGNSNVIEQAGILGVERIILVTSVGCGNTKSAIPHEVYETLFSALVSKTKAERELKLYTNLDWTIMRPGGLRNDAPTGKSILTDDSMASGSITRADVAAQIFRALGSTGQCTRRELTVVDPTFSPEYDYKPFNF